ncbi:MAG: CoA-binding protein [Lachnospiraceae bacterium]|nr:CoA-binding protein [Lachnospiraceae bacterium]
MELERIMQMQNFVVVGDTLNEEKYAYKIKKELLEKGYTVSCVGKELASINDVEGEIDVIDLCINPVKGLRLLEELNRNFKYIVIQPGAESEDIISLLRKKHYPYIEGCLLVGLSLYPRK